MVPMKKRHVIPMYSTMSVENLFEAEAIYKVDLMATLIQYSETPDVFVIENNKEPLAIVGLIPYTSIPILVISLKSHCKNSCIYSVSNCC